MKWDMMKKNSLQLMLILLVVLTAGLNAKVKPIVPEYLIEPIAKGLGISWGMALLAPDKLLVTQRSGRLLLLDLKNGNRTIISGLPAIYAKGQGGLLDIKLSPQFARQPWLYFTYAKPIDGKGRTTLARAKLNGEHLEQWQDLLVTESASDTSRHFGSRIAFDTNGHVFFSVGDRGYRPNGQDLSTHAGSILRLNLDGSVPPDNPFVGRAKVLAEIYSYGHRNPQGLAFDRKNNRLWAIEHGPRGGDEINLIKAGHNYGWPVVSFGKEYWGPISVGEGTTKAGITAPVKVYIPSIAPSSLLLYSGRAFKAWRGNLLSGALKLTHLNRIELQGDKAILEHRLLGERKQRIRQVIEDQHGYLIISTDNGDIYRLRPAD